MASLLRRILRRQSPTTLICLNRRNSGYQTLSPALLTHRSQSIDSRLSSLLPPQSPKDDESAKAEFKYDYVYPSFSYGLVVNPVFQKIVTEEEEVVVVVEEDGSGKMWADSTKKKRKKKMNKHKYKKLRKRMRNK